MSYLTHQDELLRKLDKNNLGEGSTKDEIKDALKIDNKILHDITHLLRNGGFITADKTYIHITPEGSEFISYTSFQNEYDKSFAKELYETAKQNDYDTTRMIAKAAIVIAAATLLLEVLKLLFPKLRT